MKKVILLFTLSLAALCTLIPQKGFAQGWERIYYGENLVPDGKSRLASNGDVLIIGTEENTSDNNVPIIHRIDMESNIVWTYYDTAHAGLFVGGTAIIGTSDGGVVFTTEVGNNNNKQIFLQKLTASGEFLWELDLGLDLIDHVENIIETSNGNIILCGVDQRTVSPTDLETFGVLAAFDATGNFLWSNTLDAEAVGLGISESLFFISLKEANNGDLMVVGQERDDYLDDYDILLARFSSSGNLSWRKRFTEDHLQCGRDLYELDNGDWLITVYSAEQANVNKQISVLKVDPSANEVWRKLIPDFSPESNWFYEVLPASYGFVVAGPSVTVNQGSDFLLARLNNDGDLVGSSTFGSVDNEYGVILNSAGNDEFYLFGIVESPDDFFQFYLVKSDSEGNSFTNELSGFLFFDENQDCFPANEFGLDHWVLSISQGNKEWLTTTDDLGNYSIKLDSGTFQIEAIPVSPNWTFCNNPQVVGFNGYFLSNTIDFAAQASATCPYMEVSAATPFLRRCGFTNTYSINYCNRGTALAEDAYVEFALDPAMSYISSSIPVVSQNGLVYTFDVGDVDLNTCGDFTVDVEILCDSAGVGETHCVEAHIFPDSTCLPPPTNWSGASIEVDALCTGDSVIFFIENVGTASTFTPIQYIVIEEDVILLQEEKSFFINEGIRLAFAATGATLRLEAEQELNHPKNDNPSVAVEGCVENNGEVSLGYITQFAQNDDPHYIDIDCMVNTGAYDPNDKKGFPEGFSEHHIIKQNQDLEYHVRFQNTGTDTAFNVVIRDTLSPFLNPTQLRVGAASHPFDYRLTGSGVLEFRFPNIMLPDSNINEVASHGFVRFTIPQNRNLQFGTVINNQAAIYFDFNAPIITNQTWHTVGDIRIPVGMEDVMEETKEIKVYPNPFVGESAIVEINGAAEIKAGIINVYNSIGEQVYQQQFSGERLTLSRKKLPAGIYFFQVTADGENLGSGKLIMQ